MKLINKRAETKLFNSHGTKFSLIKRENFVFRILEKYDVVVYMCM